MNNEELKRTLENHMHWLKQDCKGWENMYANLCYANLRYANLSGADLCGADLYGADLCGADLYGANLRATVLHNANLCGANLCGANLCGADLCGANLRATVLHNANLYDANLRGAIYLPYIPLACPETGSFIAYKKASKFIVKLKIPADAKRSSATTRKCRCNKAIVLEIQNLDGSKTSISEIASNYDDTFIYKIGETVTVMNFDDNRWKECSTGIHFFINRQDAVNYIF